MILKKCIPALSFCQWVQRSWLRTLVYCLLPDLFRQTKPRLERLSIRCYFTWFSSPPPCSPPSLQPGDLECVLCVLEYPSKMFERSHLWSQGSNHQTCPHSESVLWAEISKHSLHVAEHVTPFTWMVLYIHNDSNNNSNNHLCSCNNFTSNDWSKSLSFIHILYMSPYLKYDDSANCSCVMALYFELSLVVILKSSK